MSNIEQGVMVPTALTGQVLFYSQPEPLSVEAHGRLGLKPLDNPFGFAANAQAVPLQVSEFGPASLSYPIIFAGEQKTPMAIMGLRTGENLFVDADGRFEEGAYVPAFVRRYPFVLAGQDGQEQLMVCIDRAAPMLTEGGDPPLFVDGKLSAFAQGAIEFCQNFETERQRSDLFVNQMREFDLFESKAATFTARNPDGSPGQTIQLADYFAVSDEKLNKLKSKDLSELMGNGAIRQLHTHMNSMLNWELLVMRASQRAPLAANA